ncbi:hypothetical protein ACIPLA_14750 [Pseudomonas sp. NPDC086112]|uniref:hypothetical protein n=1 Tax=unclassified Pseudomonas TaxID=196821 RepID=UPI001C43AEB2|nr:hypothetical protein [Pseudomonas sp. PDM24]MBV7494450.1 hypothetical protein [Pseudomonas sp. PDM24]
MTINVPHAPAGFSEKHSSLAPRLRAELASSPLIGCESRSGLFHFIPSLAPWGCVVPMEILTGTPIFVDSLRVVVYPNELEFQLYDQVRVQWQALDGTGESFQSLPQWVLNFTALHFVVSDEEARKFEGKRCEVIFVIVREENHLPSRSLFMTLAPALIQTDRVSIEGVLEDVLEIDQHPDGVILTIPRIENLQTNNAIEMFWKSSPNGGAGGAWRDYQRKLAVSPDSPLEFRVEPSVYQGHRGELVHLFCSLFLGSGMVPGISYGMGNNGILEFKLV